MTKYCQRAALNPALLSRSKSSFERKKDTWQRLKSYRQRNGNQKSRALDACFNFLKMMKQKTPWAKKILQDLLSAGSKQFIQSNSFYFLWPANNQVVYR